MKEGTQFLVILKGHHRTLVGKVRREGEKRGI